MKGFQRKSQVAVDEGGLKVIQMVADDQVISNQAALALILTSVDPQKICKQVEQIRTKRRLREIENAQAELEQEKKLLLRANKEIIQ